MAGHRPPGFTCVVATAAPIDGGTLALTNSPNPAPVGAQQAQRLSDNDLSFIQTTAGRTIGGARMRLEALRASRERHIREYEAAAREFGPQSRAALFEQAAVDCINALITDAESPLGRATSKVRDLLQELRDSGTQASEQRLSAAIGELLGIERQLQLLGQDDEGSETSGLMVEALQASAERRNTVLKRQIDQAKRSPDSVTDDQLRSAITDVLEVERQRQLMGGSETDAEWAERMALVNEAARLRQLRAPD
jgi:hypothetical protein